MNIDLIRFVKMLRWLAILIIPSGVFAQGEGPRVYLLAPTDINAVSATYMNMSGTANFAGDILVPEGDITSDVVALNYNRMFSFGDRFAEVWATGIFGNVSGSIDAPPPVGFLSGSESGMGDPYFALRVGMIGAPALGPMDFVKHQQMFQLYALAGFTVPIGDYDSSRALNLGTNRWTFRLAAPMVVPLSFGDFPAFLEVVPSLYFYGDNDEPMGANLREQNPLFVLETHLSHNFTPKFWAGIDFRYQIGGETTTDGVADDNRMQQLGGGVVGGYQFTQSLSGFLTYGSIIAKNDGSSGDMLRARIVYVF